jgi:predicted ATPase
MITKFHIENFKCLRDVTVDLKPLTVLIGKNDTGKTSFLEALGVLIGLASGEPTPILHDNTLENVICRGSDTRRIALEATIVPSSRAAVPSTARYRLTLGLDGTDTKIEDEQLSIEGTDTHITRSADGSSATLRADGHDHMVSGNPLDGGVGRVVALSHMATLKRVPMARSLANALTGALPYRFDPQRLTNPGVFSPSRANPGALPRLHSNGEGLSSVLDYLLGTSRKAFDQLERELSEAVPQVKGIQVKPVPSQSQTGMKGISFELAGGHTIPATSASDGVLFLLAYLTLIHAPGAPAIVRLEEPENGIHPRQLERVAGYLKRLTDPSRGANVAQIVVATHSPYFLDFVPPESVVVFGRRENGDTVTAPLLDLPGVKERIESGFSLGEMWFNVGEDELLADLLK